MFTTIALPQVVAIQNDMENSLRLCIDNPLTVAVEGLTSGDILLSTDNGSIIQDEYRGAGHYIYNASVAGTATIYVKKRRGNRVENIDSIIFRVRRLPFLPPIFAGKSAGPVNHLVILAQLGIIVPGDGHADRRFPISSYSVLVYRKDKEIFRRKVLGPRIDQVTNDFFHTLKNNDKLKFENIEVKDCDGELRKTEPIEIIVKDAVSYKKVKGADTVFAEDPITGELIMNRRDSIFKQIRKYK